MMFNFKDAHDHEWIAIWQTTVRFGVSMDYDPDIMTPSGIKFCNLKTGETRFLPMANEELPNAEELRAMGEGALPELLARSELHAA